jgi:hypothetical protein
MLVPSCLDHSLSRSHQGGKAYTERERWTMIVNMRPVTVKGLDA